MVRGAGRRDRTSGTFGSVDKLATGYRARYFGPDGQRHKAPTLFPTKPRPGPGCRCGTPRSCARPGMPPEAQQAACRLTFADYAEGWLAQPATLKDRTREHYRKLLDDHLLPAFGTMALASITADDVRAWHAGFGTTRRRCGRTATGCCGRSWAPR